VHVSGNAARLLQYKKAYQHNALIITPLFITPASTCFGAYMPSSGSVLYPYELLERQKWLCCSHVLHTALSWTQ
jgi:hypothetical protein